MPTRFPSIYIFDRVSKQDDFDALYALESMTNDRIRDETGQIEMVPPEERLYGNGSGPIMAAFTHPNPLGSRFSDGSFGIFYAAREVETAIAETRHHSTNFLATTGEEPIRIQMRLYRVDVAGDVLDLRGAPISKPGVLSPTTYAESQPVGWQARNDGMAGLLYPSVRHAGGECVAALRTRILRSCLHEGQFEYHWNGKEIDYITRQVA